MSTNTEADHDSRMEATDDQSKKDDIGLMYHASIGRFPRYSIPVVLVGTMALFLSSNLNIGASTIPVLHEEEGSIIHLPPFFSFSLGNTISEMYHSRVYALMLLILIFSGVWPYLKLVLMLLAWVIPSKFFRPERRGQLLVWLDALGKYSLVDTYVLILMMVAFRLRLVLSNYAMDLFVEPLYGFYSFLAATTISLVAGHVVLYFHRRSMVHRQFPLVCRRESLMQHRFSAGRHGDSVVVMTLPFKILTMASMFASAVLLVVGSLLKSFTFEIKGVTGLLLAQDTQDNTYSFISLGQAVTDSVENPKSLSIRGFQFFYYFFGLVTPLTCLACLALLFCCPMRPKFQRILFLLAEVTNAWSGMEVFVLSIGVSLWQISRFARFIVGHKCDLINEVLKALLDDELGGDDVCFDVHSSLTSGFIYLLFGTVLNCVLCYVLLRLTRQALDERLDREGLEKGQESDCPSCRTVRQDTLQHPFVDCLSRCLFMSITKSSRAVLDPSEEQESTPLLN